MKRVALSVALLALSACASVPPTWIVNESKDEFTDSVSRMATTWSRASLGTPYTETGKLYPFVGTRGGDLLVGVRSGGQYRIPAGTVQIRVDDHEAWTITPDETPADLIPGAAPAAPGLEAQTAAAMQATAKIMSPYTAATGDKARQILRQIASGKLLKYRQIGLNQAASSTGEVAIDASFFDAMKSLGIDPQNI